ncbi:MAG: LysR substrate-binding domain-containing protein, partial [Pseudomonadota bacterium]
VDVAIRFGNGRYPGLFSRPLIREWFTPMMSPELAATYRSPADLAHATLFHAEDTEMLSPSIDWRAWFEAEGVSVTPKAGPRFSRSDHAIDAAISGSGVVLGRISLTSQALRHGQLIAPFQTALSTDAHYTLVCQAGAETLPQIAAFHDWISGETTQVDYFASGRNFVAPRQETVGNVNGGVS